MLCKSEIVNIMNERIHKCKGVNVDNLIDQFECTKKNMSRSSNEKWLSYEHKCGMFIIFCMDM